MIRVRFQGLKELYEGIIGVRAKLDETEKNLDAETDGRGGVITRTISMLRPTLFSGEGAELAPPLKYTKLFLETKTGKAYSATVLLGLRPETRDDGRTQVQSNYERSMNLFNRLRVQAFPTGYSTDVTEALRLHPFHLSPQVTYLAPGNQEDPQKRVEPLFKLSTDRDGDMLIEAGCGGVKERVITELAVFTQDMRNLEAVLGRVMDAAYSGMNIPSLDLVLVANRATRPDN